MDLTLNVEETDFAADVTKARFRILMTFQSSFVVYMVALLSFVGWIFFSVFGGVGLAALPMDLITAFTARPKAMSAEKLAHEQLLLQTRVADLIEVKAVAGREAVERGGRSELEEGQGRFIL
eukprot:evm.model.NODE_1193_length_18015_cov_29.075548.6